MTRTLAVSILLAPMLAACSSPPQQGHSTDYRIGSEIYQSGAAAEAALTEANLSRLSGDPADKKVRLLRAPMPVMPKEAINAELTDLVIVDILFNEAGDVESVLPKNYKHRVLLEAVLAVARDWKIEPPVEAGRQIKVRVRQPFRFEIQ